MASDSKTPIQYAAELAMILDNSDYVDGTSTIQKRALRKAADDLRATIEETFGDLTLDVLLAFWTGAAAQAAITTPVSTLPDTLLSLLGANNSKSPHIALSVSVALLARDLLAGERIC